VKVTGRQRRATFRQARISSIRRRHLQQRGDVRSHPGRTSEVLKRRESDKRRHQSEFDADTQTSPIGKGSNELSALTATAARKVRVSEWRGTQPAARCQPTSGISEYGQEYPAQHNGHLQIYSCASTVSKIYPLPCIENCCLIVTSWPLGGYVIEFCL